MEQYKKKLSRRIGAVMLVTGLIVVLIVYLQFFYEGEPLVNGHIYSGLLGATLGVTLVELYYVHQYQKALRSEEKLKKLYYEEFDERRALIRLKAGVPVMSFAGGAFFVSGLAASYFEPLIAYTLFGAGIFIFVYQVILKVYFTAKY